MGDTTRKAPAGEEVLPLPSSAPEAASPVPGFDLVRELARGGMGTVHEAWSHALGRMVALKLTRPDHVPDPDALLRLEREVAAQVRLTHPNIVRVLATGRVQGAPWLALELVPGETLEARLRREGPPPPARIAGWMADLAGAVAHAHAHGVLHRDLKPSNVVFGAEQVPRLIDFGVAFLTDDPGRLTTTGMLLGTPSYMAPEQVRGERASLDERTDVYGLGTILYQLLTGSPPYPGSSTIEVFEKVLSCDPIAPSRVRERVDPLLEAICLRCLARDPARRFGSAAELQAALAAWRPRSPIRRRAKQRWLIAGGLALAGVAALLLLAGRERGPPETRAVAPAPAPSAAPPAPPADPLAPLLDVAPTWSALVASARAARAAGLDRDLAALETRVPDRAARARLLFALHVEQAENIRDLLRPGPALRLLAGDLDAPPPWSNLAGAIVAAFQRDMLRAGGLVERERDLTWGALLRAPIAFEREGVEGSRASLLRALELDPGNRVAAFTLIEQEVRGKQVWDAEAILRSLAPWDADPSPPRGVRRLRAECYRLQERGFEAVEEVELLIERDPRDPEALLLRAALRLTVLNEPTLALADLDLAGDAGPGGLRLRVQALEVLSEWEALLDVAERLRGVSRTDAVRPDLDAYRLHALVELRRDAAAEALAKEMALSVRSPHPSVAQLLAFAGEELRRRRAQPVRSGSPRELLDRATFLRGRGELRPALDHVEAALTLSPLDPAALRLRGFIRMDLRQLGAAVRDLEAARPLDASGLHALGSAYFKRGDHARAAPVYEELLRFQPDNLTARITQALLRLSLSPGPDSNAEYERLLGETTGLDRTVLLRNRMDLRLLLRDYAGALGDLRALREHVESGGERLPELGPGGMEQLEGQLERLVARRAVR